jgi:hypothetical protein
MAARKPAHTDPRSVIQRAESLAAFLYRMARSDVAGVWRAGWRPALGFTGVAVGIFAFMIAPSKGIPVNYDATNIFLAMVFIQALGRSVEKAFVPPPDMRGPEAPRGGLAG